MAQDTTDYNSVAEYKPTPNGTQNLSKINRICDAFLDAFKSRPSTHVQNVISAHVCKNPPDLEAGLLMIADLQSKWYP